MIMHYIAFENKRERKQTNEQKNITQKTKQTYNNKKSKRKSIKTNQTTAKKQQLEKQKETKTIRTALEKCTHPYERTNVFFILFTTKHKEQSNTSALDRDSSSGVRRKTENNKRRRK